jgi:hypothetical protein
MRPSFKIYVIFHQKLIKECYDGIPEEMFRKYITCMGVNGKIEKTIDPWFRPSVIFERELESYDPFLQANRFCESSVYYHMHMNWARLVEPYDFVGCIQYDMRLRKHAIEYIDTTLAISANPSNILFYHYMEKAEKHYGNALIRPDGKNECLGFEGWNLVIMMYNSVYGTSHTLSEAALADTPLFHTFLMHKSIFGRIMPFIKAVVPRIFEMLHYETRHLPFHLERLFGMILSFQKMEGRLTEWLFIPDLIHDESLKDQVWKADLLANDGKIKN